MDQSKRQSTPTPIEVLYERETKQKKNAPERALERAIQRKIHNLDKMTVSLF